MEQIIATSIIFFCYISSILIILFLSLDRFQNKVYIVLFTILYPILFGILQIVGTFIIHLIGELELFQRFLLGVLLAFPFLQLFWRLYYSFPKN